MTANLKSLIIPAFYDIHKDIKNCLHYEYWLKGGRGSTKSSFVSIEIVLGIIKNPNTHAVCYRKIVNKLETSVYNQIKWSINILGLKDYFKFYKSPLKIKYTPTGQQIWFCGLDDPENSKSIKIDFGYIKYLWFEELNQFDGMREIRKVKQSVIRGGDEATIFYSYNPPPEINNWVNLEATKEIETRYVSHSTYLDVPAEWLGKPFFIEAETLKSVNNLAYLHEYMGEVVGTGLNVFTNIDSSPISNIDIKKFDNIVEGIDWGYSVDPFVFVKSHYDRKYKELYIFDEIYEVGLSNDDAIEKVIQKHSAGVEIVADSEEPKSIDDFDNAGLPIRGARKGAGSIRYGIKKLQGLNKIHIDPKRCPNTYHEFINYSYEQNKDETVKSKFPDKDNHTIDGVRYSLEDEFDY